MFLVELVMQGVRGFRELARLRFQGGFNFIAAGNEAGKTTAIDTMQRLLFPSSQPALMDALLSRHSPDASRGALVMFSDDGAYYRIIQDFSKRAVNLSKYDAPTKDFVLMHKDWETAVAFLNRLTSNMPEEDYVSVFLFRRDHYAKQPGSTAPAPPMPQSPVRPGKSAVPTGKKSSADQAKIAELREILRKAEEAADAEYKAQAAKLALDEIRKKLALLEESEQKKADLDAKLADLKACETLPPNLSELLEAYDRMQGQKTVEAEELNKHIDGLKLQVESVPEVNLVMDKYFLTGATLGVLSFLAGVFVLSSAQQIYFYGGLVLSLGLMAVAWYNGARKNAQREAYMTELEALEQERREQEKRVDPESAAIKACMKSTGAKTAGELKDKADSYRYFLSLRDDIAEQHRRIAAEQTPEHLHQEYNRLQQEALELEKAARAVAHNNIDTYAIRQDIERIDAEASQGVAWDFGTEAQDLATDFSPPPIVSGQAGFYAELSMASRVGGIEIETLVPAVEAAAQRNLAAISNGKYVRIEINHDGGAPIVHARDNAVARYTELSHGTRDLVYFCLRTGLVEAVAGKLKLPFLLDDPLAGFDPVRQKAACQILRTLGAKTQVILFSSNPALKAEGDVAVELK